MGRNFNKPFRWREELRERFLTPDSNIMTVDKDGNEVMVKYGEKKEEDTPLKEEKTDE